MSDKTTIEWCDISLSPWWGCTKVSPGCLYCYMMVLLKRWKGGKHCGKGAPRLRIESFRKNALRYNRRAAARKKRVTVFPSMCDPLDPEVPLEWFADFLDTIRLTPALTWIILTKRPELWKQRVWAVGDLLYHPAGTMARAWHDEAKPPANVWMMVSVEDQPRAEQRIPELLKIPAVKRGLSVEPMLGPLREIFNIRSDGYRGGEMTFSKIKWVICGGESGHGARPMKPEWVEDLRDQCHSACVPFFFKQWGGRTPKANGRLLDGVEHNGVPA